MRRPKAEDSIRSLPDPADPPTQPSGSDDPASPEDAPTPPVSPTWPGNPSPDQPSQVDQLIALLEKEYAELQRRLAGALNSADAASEALHDTFLKLDAV